MTWTAPHGLEVLFSPRHGFVFWTPLAVLAIAGLVWLAARSHGERRLVARLALLMIALQVYVGGSVESWTVAGAFGQRRFVALTVLLGIGLAALWEAVRGTAWRPVAGDRDRVVRVVEPRADGTLRHRADEPAAAGAGPKRL